MKHFIFSLSVLCANTPPCEGRISSRKILSLLLILFLSIGNVWGEEEPYTYTFSSFTQGSPVEFTNTNPDLTITLKVAPSGQGNTTKPQWNSGSSQARVYAGGTMSIAIGSGTITKIVYDYVINASSGTKPTISGVEGTTSAGTWDDATKTWTGSDTEVLFSTSGTKGNVGFKSFTITYSSSTASDQPSLSVVTVSGTPTKTIYETGEVFVPTGLTVTGTYGTGAETTQQEITSGITWTANNGSEYVALENVSLTQGQTSIQVKATVNEITSEAYTANITVNAAPTKITFLASQLGGTNDKYELKDGSASGVTYMAYSYTKGEGANFQFNGKDGKTNIFYNTSAMPGAITILKAVKASGTDRSVTPYVSTAPLTKDNYSTAGIALSAKNVVEGGTIWTISEESSLTAEQKSAEYKYFYFHYSTSGALYVSKFEVAYKEVAGGDEGGTEEPAPSLSATPTTIDFGTVYEGATVADQTVAVNFANLTGAVTYSGLSTPFSATGAIAATGDKITISADASTIGEYSQTLTVASTADSKTAEVTVKMNVVAAPAPTGTFEKFIGTLEEGDYVLVANGTTDALKSTITDNRFDCGTVEVAEDKIVNPDKSVIWHIAANDKYWTMYNESATKYAGGTTSKNQGALLDDVTDLAKWTITVDGEGVYTFENYGRSLQSSNAGNKFLSKNSQNSYWATYASGQKNPVLYKKSDGKQPAGLTYETSKYRTKLGDSFVTPTLTNPNSLNVTYSSSNNDVAEVATDGSVTIKAVGGVEITATFAGSETHRQGSAKYTICVTEHAGTQADPYSVADARRVIDVMEIAEGVYAKGLVSEIVTAYNSQYGNISYNISADGLTTGDQLQAYRGFSYDGVWFTSADDIKVGDEVVVKGNLKKHNTTYEFDAGNQLVSLNRTKEQAGLSYTTTEYNVNLGDAFTAPTLNNPHSLAVTYSSNNEDVAIVAADGSVTIKTVGMVTITASFAGDASYAPGEASYTIKVMGIASLPFAFDGKCADIATTEGMTHSGIDAEDYKSAPYLKINTTGDYLTIHFDSEPDKLTYDIKGNSFSGGTFTVQESADGETYTTIATYTELGDAATKEHELAAESRYVKFIYTEKVDGNVALGNISITKPDNRKDAGLAWSKETVTLTVGDAFTAPTLQYPNDITGTITYETSNDEVATVTTAGVIALGSATGTATITATFAGDATYKPAEATCVVIVNEYVEIVSGEWQLVTDAAALRAGDKVIVASAEAVDGKYYALSTTQNKNNRGQADVNKIEENVTFSTDVQVLTLEVGVGENTFAFNTGSGYLYAASSSSNYLKTQEDLDANGSWTISIDANTGVATVKAQGENSHNLMQYNKSSKLFSSYENPQQGIALYKKMPDYTRDVDPQYYGTICLPKAGKFVGGSLYEVAYYDETTKKVYFDEVLNGEMEAGMPYIFLANATMIEAYYTNDEGAEAKNKNGLYGTLVDITSGMNADGVYMIYRNQIIHSTHSGSYLNANRAYIKLAEVPGYNDPSYVAPAPAPGRKRIAMGTTGQNTATGIDQVQGDNVPTKMIINGQFFILRGEKMYDAQGKLVK